MMESRLDPEHVLEAIRESPHNRVRVAVCDIDGVLRGKFMHKQKFLKAVQRGFGFCNVVFGWDIADVCYENNDVKYTGWHSGYPDADVQLDLHTYRRVPWDDGVPFVLGEFVDKQGDALSICPRQLLRNVIERAREMGYTSYFGSEFEFFNFSETPDSLQEKGFQNMQPLTPGMFGYSILRASLNHQYFRSLMEELGEFRVPIEGLHTETGPGVYEAAILYSDPLEAADRAILFKTGAKEIAYRYDIIPTFMAKWHSKLPGSSGHLHQSIWDLEGHSNLFADDDDPQGISQLFRHYIGGQLKCLPEILPMFAPTVNSYKRLVEGLWAPTRVAWGIDNRTGALRVIRGGKSTRLETRVTGADINPYLAIAAALASGLYGIANAIEPGEAVEGSAYEAEDTERLPRNLYEAARRMADSSIANELFGEDFVDHYTKSRLWEWDQFQQHVSDWELKRYFELV